MREADLLKHIYRSNASLGDRVILPPGDDMGALHIAGQSVLISVDQLADGVHVDAAHTPVEKVGRKAITRNLSDVAAMAAKPVGAVAAASLPRRFGEKPTVQLFDAMRAAAAAYDCPLMGGDVSMWDHPLLLTITLLAEPAGIEPVLRRGARPSDVIYVTGRLGGSLEAAAASGAPDQTYVHHLDFEPRIALARRLAADPATRPHAMIDLSDGLARDLQRVCEASGVSAIVFADRLPLSAGALPASRRSGRQPWEHAVGDGEDYELLFTLPPQAARATPGELEGAALTPIGEIRPAREAPRVELRLAGGRSVPLDDLGWEHRT